MKKRNRKLALDVLTSLLLACGTAPASVCPGVITHPSSLAPHEEKTMEESRLEMPAAERSGFVRTLNGQGYMTSTLDDYSRAFVDFAPKAPGPVLEIGAAYGVATLEAIQVAPLVLANDLDDRHLKILYQRAPEALRSRLRLLPGDCPKAVRFAAGSLGAILMARVMHFFDPERVVEMVSQMHEWLAVGGKAFIVVETPYLRNFQTFIPEFERRKRAGDLWPGFIEDVMKIAPERGASLPPKMHFFDPDILKRVFTEHGFSIERVGTMDRTDFPDDLRWDGRESVGIIGVKVR